VRDVVFSAAFDIHADKVGRDLADAIMLPPNNTCRFSAVPATGVVVRRGPTLDGRGRYVAHRIPESVEPPVDVAAVLRETGSEVLVCYLPVGSEAAVRHYAEQALAAGCAFVNCIPVFIASDPRWQERFAAKGLPLIGDDIKSQVGATIVHRMLTRLFRERGVRLDRTYQLNFGGNTDFENMLERERLQSKKTSKTNAVMSQLDEPLPEGCAHVGPSDHVPWLLDRKFCYIRMEGTGFGQVPMACELKLEVWDSPNSAGVVIDAVRCAGLAMDRGLSGPLIGPCSYFMKSPPEQFPDHRARSLTEAFIAGRAEAP
jgi:myo-inositol-1-phosphate synthase